MQYRLKQESKTPSDFVTCCTSSQGEYVYGLTVAGQFLCFDTTTRQLVHSFEVCSIHSPCACFPLFVSRGVMSGAQARAPRHPSPPAAQYHGVLLRRWTALPLDPIALWWRAWSACVTQKSRQVDTNVTAIFFSIQEMIKTKYNQQRASKCGSKASRQALAMEQQWQTSLETLAEP